MNKAKLLNEFSQLLDDIENLQRHESLYEYEKEFVEKYEQFGKLVFENSMGKQEKDRRKKSQC